MLLTEELQICLLKTFLLYTIIFSWIQYRFHYVQSTAGDWVQVWWKTLTILRIVIA